MASDVDPRVPDSHAAYAAEEVVHAACAANRRATDAEAGQRARDSRRRRSKRRRRSGQPPTRCLRCDNLKVDQQRARHAVKAHSHMVPLPI